MPHGNSDKKYKELTLGGNSINNLHIEKISVGELKKRKIQEKFDIKNLENATVRINSMFNLASTGGTLTGQIIKASDGNLYLLSCQHGQENDDFGNFSDQNLVGWLNYEGTYQVKKLRIYYYIPNHASMISTLIYVCSCSVWRPRNCAVSCGALSCCSWRANIRAA